MLGVGGGGKTLFGEQRLERFEETFLILFDRQQIIAALFIKDLAHGRHLRVRGIGQHHFADDVQLGQLVARGGDFIAGWRDQRGTQPASGPADGADRCHIRVPDFLAVEDHQPVLHRPQDLLLPQQEHPFQHRRIHRVEDALKGRSLRTTHLLGVSIQAKLQGPQLGR